MIVQIHFNNTHVANVILTTMPKTHEDALERAYEATQNVFGSWSKGPMFGQEPNPDYNRVPGVEVQVLEPLRIIKGVEYGHRSSMVGDKFVIGDFTYEVDFVGFKGV